MAIRRGKFNGALQAYFTIRLTTISGVVRAAGSVSEFALNAEQAPSNDFRHMVKPVSRLKALTQQEWYNFYTMIFILLTKIKILSAEFYRIILKFKKSFNP